MEKYCHFSRPKKLSYPDTGHRVPPGATVTALILLHSTISARLADKRCETRYRISDRIMVPVPKAFVTSKSVDDTIITQDFEFIEETLKNVSEVLENKVPDIIFVEANYSYPGSVVPNRDLINYLTTVYTEAKFIAISTTQACLDVVFGEYSSALGLSLVCVNPENTESDVFFDPFTEEEEMISRVHDDKNGRRFSGHW